MSIDEIRKCCGVQTLDIHAGGIDLIFPHHENEIAQSEGATGQTFARHWVHGEFLNVRGTKMSKRYGNTLTARDLRDQGIDAAAVRLLLFQTHYRQPVDFNDDALVAAGEGVRRLAEFQGRLAEVRSGSGADTISGLAEQVRADVAAALNDDLNAPQAIAKLFEFVRAANRELDKSAGGAASALAAMREIAGGLFDVFPTPKKSDAALERGIAGRVAPRNPAPNPNHFNPAAATPP